jgi:signal transduction histidine kinase
MTGPLALLSRFPARAASVVAVAMVFECGVFTTPQSMAALFAGMAASAGVARYAQGRGLWLLVVLGVLNVWVAFRDPTDTNKWDYIFTFMIWASAAIGAWLLRGRHTAILRAFEEAVRLRTDRGIAVEKAISDERARIARDLHDVVAHAVSLMVIQAAAGRSVLAMDPRRAEGAFDTIELSGQRALGDLRRLLGLLQAGEQEQAETPGLSSLETLVRDANAAGVPCRLTWTGERGGLPDGVDVAAFRVVQESVTNALKHGAHAGLDIDISLSAAGVRVIVLDRATDSDPATRDLLPGAARGLRGMRERVGLYDGTLAAGPETDGWRVEAFFPVPTPT